MKIKATFFTTYHPDNENSQQVFMLGINKSHAKSLFLGYNPGMKWRQAKADGWIIIKVKLINTK